MTFLSPFKVFVSVRYDIYKHIYKRHFVYLRYCF